MKLPEKPSEITPLVMVRYVNLSSDNNDKAYEKLTYFEEADGTRYIALPEPSSYNGSTSTMFDSGTSVSGHLLASIVREDVATVSLSWPYLSKEEWAEINQLFKTENGSGDRFINKVRFFNQTTGAWETRDMYVNNRGAGMWRRDDKGVVKGWTGCSLGLTEV